jgi:hypothetical protein
MVSDLHHQLEEARAAERAGYEPRDTDWWRRVVKVKSRCDTLHAHLQRRLKSYRRRTAGMTVAGLLKAVSLHRQTVTAEYQPTPADEELWKVLS